MQFFEKLIGKDQNNLGYSLEASLSSGDKTFIWKLYRGKNKETKEAALVFVHQVAKENGNKSLRSLAKNGLQRLKTLRHPNILKFYNAVESENSISFATEEAFPFYEYIQRYGPMSIDTLCWGVFCLARALEFIHSDCKLVHGNISPASIFITPGGDWKLGSFEASVSDLSLLRETVFLRDEKYCSPELLKQQWNVLSKAPLYSVDSWAFGCFIQEIFSGTLRSAEQLKKVDVIPKDLVFDYQKLLSSNPSSRLAPGKLLENKCLQSNSFVNMNLFLENFELEESLEKNNFLQKIMDMVEQVPSNYLRFKLLPVLCTSMECGSGGTSVLNCISAIFNRIADDNCKQELVRQHVVKWFANVKLENRVVRTDLVNKMELFAPFMDRESVNKIVFPFICQNLKDLGSPALRDNSIKAVIHIVDVLDGKQLNSVLMGHLAKVQLDREPAIRANTTVCLGKIANHLSESTKKKVLIPAFTRSLKDPFPPARVAGLVSLIKTAQNYQPADMATRILPAVVPCLVDDDNETRTQAFECLEFFVEKIRQLHEQMLRGTANSTATETNTRNDMDKAKPASESTKSSGWNFTSLAASLAMQLSESIVDAHATQQPSTYNKYYQTSFEQHEQEMTRAVQAEGSSPPILSREKETRSSQNEESDNWDLLIDFSEPLPYHNESTGNTSDLQKTKNIIGSKPNSSTSSVRVSTCNIKPATTTFNNTTRLRPIGSSLDQIVSESSRSRRKQPKEKEEDDDWSALLGGPDIPSRRNVK
ncbi:uncharacterized protein Gasu_11330 [Galdieria sulphuraria]|uniref:Protein kinase domain-containing protein n=1 Tax=Galdieria sulphuraria TaxID=130081 RepID=M2Y6U4_GALSU|nr:uncharacterized protein Gasu_11330 [Galdieria sulphuraria]EME31758.1 hypothetical protein Gasu_11330 [Galdieria sulphuraria]|eukprot:XP_005708278.1 hypothetical protein Gasu_11330 [Galdieria sulphuraria]